MSLWLERYIDLDRYHTYRREAEEHRLASQGRVRQENALLINHSRRSILLLVSAQVGLFLHYLKRFLAKMVLLPIIRHSFPLKARG